jgi:hypothetical protein
VVSLLHKTTKTWLLLRPLLLKLRKQLKGMHRLLLLLLSLLCWR